MKSVLLLLSAAATLLLADLESSYVLPLDHAAIQYVKTPVDDAIARLQAALSRDGAKLEYDSEHGYLPAVLRALDIPASSQVLVFSKTSFQAHRISPRTPRALYFSDTVSIGWVKGGDVLEVASLDPKQGTIFYVLDQERKAAPTFERRDDCIQCHSSSRTLGVPGIMVRSLFVNSAGEPQLQAGGFGVDHRTPLNERWGGWYVTGTHGKQRHMGNVFANNRSDPRQLKVDDGANLTQLRSKFDTGAYLTPHSDIVALMVLEHQTRMHSLLTRIGWETRMAVQEQAAMNRALGEPESHFSETNMRRITRPADELVEYMLFGGEAPIGELRGTSDFARDFAARGPRDSKGRSLRDFALNGRVFKYPLSYMVHSEAFDSLPPMAKDYILRKLFDRLTAPAATPEQRAVVEILRETKRDLPAYWKS